MRSLMKKVHSVEKTIKLIKNSLLTEKSTDQANYALSSNTAHNECSLQPSNSSSPSNTTNHRALPKTKQSKIPFPISSAHSSSPKNPYHINSPTPIPDKNIQTRINNHLPTDREWIGSKMCPLEQNEFRLWIQNVNGFDISQNFNIFMEHFDYIKKYDIGYFAITESKLNPYSAYVNENIESAFQKIHPGGTSNLTNQFINNEDLTQYGGIFSAVTKTLSHRVASKGKDYLGRYNWIDFYGTDSFLRIYTIYRVNPGCDSSSGDDTCWMHQRTALTLKNCDTDPRKQVVLDIVKALQEDIRLHRHIIICGDINENITTMKGFNKAMIDLGLQNIITKEVGLSTPFRTHNRGQGIIDGVWTSPTLLPNIVRCGIAPFNHIFSSDHRGIFLDLNMHQFLDSSSVPLLSHAYRRLKYTVPKRVESYTKKGLELWNLQRMDLRIQQLEERLPLFAISEQQLLLNKIDSEIGDIMTASEKVCCTVGRHCTHLFSKELKIALRNNRQCKMNLARVLMQSGDGVTTQESIKSAVSERRNAKRYLKQCQKNSKPLRDQMLDDLAIETMHMHPQRGKQKKSVIKQLKHCETSRINADKIRFSTKGPRPSALSHILIPNLEAYTTDEQQNPDFDIYNIDIIWERTQRFNGKDIRHWKRVDDIDLVTRLISQILMKHFGQSTGTPFANVYWKEKLSDPNFQKTLLDGTFCYDDSLPQEANDLLQSFSTKQNVKEIPLLPTWKDFVKFISNAKEKTSSSPSGRHYGHYKSLLHSAPSILRGIYKILCLSLQYGIVLDRWKKTITTVICKDDNTPFIHRLRPLHIVEAELQFFSKCQWSHKLIQQAEHLKNISPSQFGGRKNKQAQSSVITTVLTFDIHRQLRKEYTFNDDDLRANYDRELAHFSVAETRSHGLSAQAGKMLIDITTQQQFHIRTKNGVSSSYYSYTPEIPVWGLGQGISWAGSCWQFTATSIENCLKRTCCGALISNPMNTIRITSFLKFFIDDTTKICNQTFHHPTIMEQTTHNMQKHFNYVVSTGGTLALDKCRFYFIKFQFDDNHDAVIMSNDDNPGDLEIFDSINNTRIKIQRIEPNEARRTLGCFISPTNNQTKQLSVLREFIIEWKNQMKFSSLSPILIITAYETILKPKLVYRLSTTSLSYRQCDDLVKLIRPTILHAHNTHEHFPKSILESSSLYAGYNFVHLYDLQGQEKFKFFTYHIRQMDDTGKSILTSLQYTQLSLGIRDLFLNQPYHKFIQLTEQTWCTNLWEYFSHNELSVDLSHAISVPPQRKGDLFIMDFLFDKFSIHDLIKINKIRLSLKLVFLSDIVDIRGRHVLPDIREGVNYRNSTITFPYQTFSPSWLKIWKQACDKINNFVSTHSLTNWTQQHFQWNTNISSCHKFLTIGDTAFELTSTSNTYIMSQSPVPSNITYDLPVDIYKTRKGYKIISMMRATVTSEFDQVIRSYDKFSLFGKFERDNEEAIVQAIKTNKVKMSCDGSVLNKYGSFAYGLAPPQSDTFLFSQHAPVHGDLDQITSTRCELMGLLACVEYLRYIGYKYSFDRKYFILITADNEVAIKAPKKNYRSTKHTFSSDMDIILHIKALLQNTPFTIKFQHVRGHQDKHKPYNSLSTLAKLNIGMDKLAKQYFTDPVDAPPYSIQSQFLYGSSVSITDSHSRIVSRFPTNLKRHRTGMIAEQQLAKALRIHTNQLSLLDWETFPRMHSRQPKHIKSFLTKSIYHHLPTMVRQHRWGISSTKLCPICSQCDESSDHLFQCTHPSIQKFRRNRLAAFRDELSQLDTDPFLIRHLMRIILQWTNKFPVTTIPLADENIDSIVAINEQIRIGVNNMIRGVIGWRLGSVQQNYFRSKQNFKSTGDAWVRKLTQFFFTFSHDIWKYRCDKVSESTESTYEAQIRKDCDSLLFTLSKNPTSLPVKYRYLLHRPSHFTSKATTRALQSWLTRVQQGLKMAKEGTHRSTSDIRNWFSSSQPSPEKPPAAEEIVFTTESSDNEDSCTDITICTVPLLPYVPYQTSTLELPISKPSIQPTSRPYCDI